MKKNKAGKIRPIAFYTPFIFLLGMAIYSLTAGMENEKAFVASATNVFNATLLNFGWFYGVASLGILIFIIYLAFSKHGNIRFGGPDAKPEFTYWNWFAMSLCAGIAIGIVFWGVAEPIMQLTSPPESYGFDGFTDKAAIFSLSQIYLEWTFTPYAMYCLCGIASAYTYYNLKRPKTIASTLYPLLGKWSTGKGAQVIDAIIIFALVGGVVVALGEGILQLASGLDYQFGIPATRWVWGIISLIIVVMYTVSSYTGLAKGIRILSDINAKIFIGLMIFVFLVGPTAFILNIGFESVGSYVETLFTRHLFFGAVSGDAFPRWWTLFFFAIWFAWAPITGIFLSRMAYGRTIKEFVAVNMVAPALFGMVWFAIFGGTAMHMEMFQKLGLAEIVSNNGPEIATFAFLGNLPFSQIIIPIFFLTIILSFVTAADSMTSTVALISVEGGANDSQEAPAGVKIAWALIMGLIAWVVISFAKIDGIKMVATIVGVPAAILVVAQGFSLWRMVKSHKGAEIEVCEPLLSASNNKEEVSLTDYSVLPD
jgi:choline/carnitine/betaine transport